MSVTRVGGGTDPSPGHTICKCASNQRTEHGGNTIRGAREAKKRRASLWWCGESDDREQADSYTGTAHSSDRSAYDECLGILGHATDQTAELEDKEGDKVPELERKVLEKLSPG